MFSSDSIFSIGWEVHPIEKIESATALIFHSRAEAGSFLFFRWLRLTRLRHVSQEGGAL
jgi:hypothetical protein